MFYTKLRVRCPSQDLEESAAAVVRALSEQADHSLWGMWQGLFGVPSDQLILMTQHERGASALKLPDGIEALEQHNLRATARPTSAQPEKRRGVYVFRTFATYRDHIDEIVQLSSEAWQTFESGKDYEALPVGLFAPVEPAATCAMHLLTWYPDFTAWQNSRNSDPQALRRFAARRALTTSTVAIATRSLVSDL